jgi:ParB family transcriptional regulator, chromosome partitioning protein
MEQGMKGRDILKSMVGTTEPGKADGAAAPLPHRPAGAVRAMNLSLGRLNEEAAAAKALRETIASGDKVIELDTATVELSFIQDRIPVDRDSAFEELKHSIEENGQQIPILVRPHPEKPKAYQVAYGHRRLRAMSELGKPVRAIVRNLTDEELILAQAQENGPRVDLSFIERALFARRMDEHGLDRETISKALSVDKPETSRLLQVAEGVPADIILAIGPAPKIGRPRWLAFAERLRDGSFVTKVNAIVASPEFLAFDSNKRFEHTWKTLNAVEKAVAASETIATSKGREVGSLVHGRRGAKLTITSKNFAEFLADEMPTLVARFEASGRETS